MQSMILITRTQVQGTLTRVGSITAPALVSMERRWVSSSTTQQRAVMTSAAVWRQRRKGETMIRWTGKPTFLSLFPVVQARILPVSVSGGSHGRSACDSHRGSAASILSPCLIMTTFCVHPCLSLQTPLACPPPVWSDSAISLSLSLSLSLSAMYKKSHYAEH
ncbi:hypothetical protein MA16_Dca026907 [Dendrobium catenatum]|uniref:Uncharacterized protein n=1 Tax=Dendrobium catenatum TaxID=906689 RepID=A0A2I0VFE6_9ASPA|nr:hypothetical protein MA16_Dca026907 [Dendrobium catenatum]